MLKRVMVVLVSAAAALALSAAPANADPEPGVLSLYESTDMADREVHLVSGTITTTCTPLPEPLTGVGAQSGHNFTPKAVAFYTTLADCNADIRQDQMKAGDPLNDPVADNDFGASVFFYRQVTIA